MAGRSVVRMVGPLAPYASGFYRELRSRGYTHLSAVWQLRLMAHASRWLAGQGLDAAGFAGCSGCRGAGGFSITGGSDIFPRCPGAPGFAVGVAAA